MPAAMPETRTSVTREPMFKNHLAGEEEGAAT
jgi:hypothetical protein